MNVSAEKRSTMTGIFIMIIGMITLASTDAVSKHLTVTFAVVQILWIRFIIFAGVGAFAVLTKRGFNGLRTKRPIAQIVRASMLLSANLLAVYTLSLMPLADAHATLAIAPLLVTAASVPFLGEVIDVRRWIAIGTGFMGVLIILRPGLGVFDFVAIFPLAVAILFAGYNILTKIISRDDTNETTLFYTGATGLIVLSVIIPFFWISPSLIDWGWLIVAGIGGSFAHIFIITALHFAPASKLQPFNYVMLVWATILGFFIFDDLPDYLTVLGATVIVISGLYAWNRERLN
ncbi:DMT family transporter [Rhodospirillaceae bacterium]|nr:DMT family transporter [Rhodospirillaceae bacterium]MDC1441300.1 DMT family transporter [Rhodospirillaceae bacterium]MDG1275271.1 DMT family transporter [Alphaproteobacteria bacterium]MDG1887990.1 DMT family transporter [Alphaproteobacteria bacterium]